MPLHTYMLARLELPSAGMLHALWRQHVGATIPGERGGVPAWLRGGGVRGGVPAWLRCGGFRLPLGCPIGPSGPSTWPSRPHSSVTLPLSASTLLLSSVTLPLSCSTLPVSSSTVRRWCLGERRGTPVLPVCAALSFCQALFCQAPSCQSPPCQSLPLASRLVHSAFAAMTYTVRPANYSAVNLSFNDLSQMVTSYLQHLRK
jgi:hypothetical protein